MARYIDLKCKHCGKIDKMLTTDGKASEILTEDVKKGNVSSYLCGDCRTEVVV